MFFHDDASDANVLIRCSGVSSGGVSLPSSSAAAAGVSTAFAAVAGFERPILHGLCTFGNIGRAVIEGMCDGDPTRFRSIKVRFAAPVIPGETIVTDMWKESDTDIIVRGRVKERDVEVVKNARVTIRA